MNFDQTAGFMESVGFPAASVFLIIGIAIEIIGGLSVLVGYKSDYGAALLVVFLVIVTIVFHRNISDQNQFVQFTKNIAIIGGLLYIVHFGTGAYSLDNKKAPKIEKLEEPEEEE